MTLKIFLTLSIPILFSGCCTEVKVPVKCITPEVKCNIEGNPVQKIIGMSNCIYAYEDAVKVCQ